MIVTVDVRIQSEPGDSQISSYGGNLSFSEQANFTGAGFETISKIFTRCHELLDILKQEHAAKGKGYTP